MALTRLFKIRSRRSWKNKLALVTMLVTAMYVFNEYAGKPIFSFSVQCGYHCWKFQAMQSHYYENNTGTLRNVTSISWINTDSQNDSLNGAANLLLSESKVNLTSGQKTNPNTMLSTNRTRMFPNDTMLDREMGCVSCFYDHLRYIIDNRHVCAIGHNTSHSISLLLLVTSSPDHTSAREALRRTWLSITRNNTADVRHLFILGSMPANVSNEVIWKENDKYHDILQGEFLDTYYNLTYKTMMGFQWATKSCPHTAYVMKTDDDMFVNIPNILTACKMNHAFLVTGILGSCYNQSWPHRNVDSKYYTSLARYPTMPYPGYCSGTGYVTSINVVTNVYMVSRSVQFFHLEDVYVGICLKHLGYSVKHVIGFGFVFKRTFPCLFRDKKTYTVHHISEQKLYVIWLRFCSKSNSVQLRRRKRISS